MKIMEKLFNSIRDNTKIENLTMQSLLADEGTKNELVTYLAKKTLALCESESNRHTKAYVTPSAVCDC
jgi:hypothetical protein